MTTTELIEILSNAEKSVSEIDYDKYLYKIFNDRLMLEISDEVKRKLADSNIYLKSLGLKIIPVITKDMNVQGCRVDLEVENSKMPFATVSFNKDELQKIVDKKVQEYEIDAEKIRAKAIDEFAEKLSKYLDVENATKYGNTNAEQQRKSYDTLMKYEIADAIEDIAEQMKEGV